MYTIICVIDCTTTYIKVPDMTSVLQTLVKFSSMNEDSWVTCVLTPKGTMIACDPAFTESKDL